MADFLLFHSNTLEGFSLRKSGFLFCSKELTYFPKLCHAIRFSDLIALWVIKIKKSMILCALSTFEIIQNILYSKQHMKHTVDEAPKRFVYSKSKIVIFSDYQTWPTHSQGAQRFLGFFLDCAFRILLYWAGKYRSHGGNCTVNISQLFLIAI